jgi:hypothetical protein
MEQEPRNPRKSRKREASVGWSPWGKLPCGVHAKTLRITELEGRRKGRRKGFSKGEMATRSKAKTICSGKGTFDLLWG